MVPGSVFERVYSTLKQQLREGRFAPGERMEPSSLAADLASSVTPVRDALHRLAGERLVQAARRNGFRVPLLTERDLRQLYGWHGDLTDLAASRLAAPSPAGSPASAPGGALDLTSLFAALGGAGGNAEHLDALRAATDRLMPFRLREPMILDGCDGEAEALAQLLAAAERSPLRRFLRTYHRRRIARVPDLLAAIGSKLAGQ